MKTSLMKCMNHSQSKELLMSKKQGWVLQCKGLHACHMPFIRKLHSGIAQYFGHHSFCQNSTQPRHDDLTPYVAKQLKTGLPMCWVVPNIMSRFVNLCLARSPFAMPSLVQALTSSLGWTYLDVRSQLEVQDVGRVKDSVNIPMVFATKKWDSDQQKKVVKKEDNTNFVRDVILQ